MIGRKNIGQFGHKLLLLGLGASGKTSEHEGSDQKENQNRRNFFHLAPPKLVVDTLTLFLLVEAIRRVASTSGINALSWIYTTLDRLFAIPVPSTGSVS
jgi:hypothetical protein